MRSFDAEFDLARAKRGTAPVNLLEFAFAAGTVRLSDRDILAPSDPIMGGLNEFNDDKGWLSKSGNVITVTGMDQDWGCFFYTAGGISGDFEYVLSFRRFDSGGVGLFCGLWAVYDFPNDASGLYAESAILWATESALYLKAIDSYNVETVDSFGPIFPDTDYYLSIGRAAGVLTCHVFADSLHSVLLGSLQVPLAVPSFSYLMTALSNDIGFTGAPFVWSGTISGLSRVVPYDGLVKSWGFIDSAAGSQGAGLLGRVELADLGIEIVNSGATAFSQNFAAQAPEEVEVSLYQWFKGIACKELLFRGYVYGQPEYDQRTCRLTIRSIWERYNRVIGDDLVISADEFASADPDDIGRMRNVVIGAVDNVRCRSIVAGVMDTLRHGIDAGATGFYVSQAGKVDFPAGTVVIQIDDEKISGTYAPSAGIFTSCTRGYGGTTALPHDAGARVAQVLTTYIYEVASHPVKSIGAVRVGDVKQTSGYTTYTGQPGDELAGYAGTAVIAFTVLPIVRRQVNLSVDATAVSINEGSHAHGAQQVICVWHFDTATEVGAVTHFPEVICDKQLDTATTLDNVGAKIAVGKAFYEEMAGPPELMRVCMRSGFFDGSYIRVRFTFAGKTVELWDSYSTGKSAWSAPGATWAQLNGAVGYVEVISATSINYAKIAEVWCEFAYTPAVAAAPAVGVEITGEYAITGNSSADTVIGGNVCCDVDGWPDDDSGTYTGSPGALIQRPDHVFRLIWGHSDLVGAPDADFAVEAAAASYFSTAGYKFSLRLYQPVRVGELLSRLALQCRSRFYVTPCGAAGLTLRQTGKSSSLSIPMEKIRDESMRIRRTHGDDLVNAMTIRYDRDNGEDGSAPEQFTAAKKVSDATSIAAYGRRVYDGDLLMFDAVADATMAADVAAFLLAWHKQPRRILVFDVFLDSLEIEPADVIDITHPLDALAGAVCEVMSVTHTIGSAEPPQIDRLTIEALEV